MNLELTLSADQFEQLVELAAERAAEKLRGDNPQHTELVDAATVARHLGVHRDTVYAHADELGARRAGEGERPRLRFDLETALDAWPTIGEPRRTTPRRRQHRGGDLLPVHDS